MCSTREEGIEAVSSIDAYPCSAKNAVKATGDWAALDGRFRTFMKSFIILAMDEGLVPPWSWVYGG